MNRVSLVGLAIIVSAALAAVPQARAFGPNDDLKEAIQKLAEQDNYSWKSERESAGG